MWKKGLVYVLMLVCLLIFCISYKIPDKQINSVAEQDKKDSIVFVFAGDVMGHMPQIEAAYNRDSGIYDFRPCYQYISPYIKSADLAIANLEVPLAGKPYTGYPRFSSPDALLDGALSAGFDVMQLANNHVADKGNKGIEYSYAAVNAKTHSVGVYLNEAQRDSLYPLIMNVKGVKIAILNCTFGTNGNAVYKPIIVNRIDTAQIRHDVQRAKSRGARFVVLTIHWGTEYELKANSIQTELAHFFVNVGIDLIIGAHPHVVQNFELISRADSTTVPVFYSLGNMVSNQYWRNSNGGILAKVTLDKTTCKVLHCNYLPFYVYKGKLAGKFQYYLIPTKAYMQKKIECTLPLSNDSLLNLFDSDTHKRLSNILEF